MSLLIFFPFAYKVDYAHFIEITYFVLVTRILAPVRSCMPRFSSAGPGAMAGSALLGGLILAMIEGMGIMLTKITSEQFAPVAPGEINDPGALGPATGLPNFGATEERM